MNILTIHRAIRRTLTITATICVAALLLEGASAEDSRPPVARSAQGLPDYAVQGEYIGSLLAGEDAEMFGVQVYAEGKGAFKATAYPGGLPGAGWHGRTDPDDRLFFAGKTAGERTVLEPDPGKAAPKERRILTIHGGRMTVRSAGPAGGAAGAGVEPAPGAGGGAGVEVGRLERVVRRSPTVGKDPPEGAVVLFDGKAGDRFVNHGRRNEPVRVTEDGNLELFKGSGGLETKDAFGDCTLHLEFCLPFEPEGRGQGRANSGAYLQGRYEIQILDSFGLEGWENECGGLYSTGKHPKVNMCFPPLVWQTYDVEFTAARWDGAKKTANARMTVVHNGVTTYVGQEIPRDTTASPKKEEPGPMFLYLQDHGHDILFRNIWLVPR